MAESESAEMLSIIENQSIESSLPLKLACPLQFKSSYGTARDPFPLP